MKTITLTHENLEKEHICCALTSPNDIQVVTKKKWLKEQLNEGLVFTKMDIRGKCFIEYTPIENAWAPLKGKNLFYIQCMWCAGKYQGQGYAKTLLEKCKSDAISKGKEGLAIISSKTKRHYLMDYNYLIKQGFYTVDRWGKDYELLFLPLSDQYEEPKFNCSKIDNNDLILYYTDQCPFNAKYVQLLYDYCCDQNIPLRTVHIETKEEAQSLPTPMSTYSLFYKGEFVSREVLTIKKFEKVWKELND